VVNETEWGRRARAWIRFTKPMMAENGPSYITFYL
jgi:hypothetical protein